MSQPIQPTALLNDETAAIALVERMERTVKNQEELQRKLDLEIAVRKRLREELTKAEAAMAEKDAKLQSMEEMHVNQINLGNSIKMLEQNLKAKEDQMKDQYKVIDEFQATIEKKVDWTAGDAGGQNIAEASAQIRSLEKLQQLHESRSMQQQ